MENKRKYSERKDDEIKLLPEASDVERIVLGSIILESESFDRIAKDFSEMLFFHEKNRIIAKSIIELYKSSTPIDLLTVVKKIREYDKLNDVGGPTYVSGLTNGISSSVNIDHHVKILQEEALRRNIILISNKAIQKSFDATEDVFEVFNDVQHNLDNALKNVVNYEIRTVGQVHSQVISDSLKVLKSGQKSGVATGLRLLDNVTNGWQKSDLIIIAGRPGMGKELKNSSLIYTPYGHTTIGQIKVGEKILGSDGNSYNVTGVYPQGKKDVYRVHFDDGTFVDAGLEHQWEVTTRLTRKNRKTNKEIVVTTKQMLNDVILSDNRKNYAIRFCQPLNFEEKKLLLDPYLLGALIGDGCFTNTSIVFSNNEPDVIEKVANLLPNALSLKYPKIDGKYDHRISQKVPGRHNSILRVLKEFKLDAKRSHEKHIPKEYLYNSVNVRIKLLQGLIDTDGFITKSGRNQIEYSTTSYQLCLDILELVRGLGGKASFQEKQGSYRKNGDRIETRKYYRMYLSLPSNIIPVSSKKHLSKYKSEKKYHCKYIVSIEKMEYQEEMTCISVDAPDSLYITDGYTLTHNTSVVVSMALYPAVQLNEPIAIFSLEMSAEQLVSRMQSQYSDVNVSKIVKKQLTEDEIIQIERSTEKLKIAPMFIDDTPNISLLELKGKVRKLVKEEGVRLVIIDYLQLMRSGIKTQSRELEVSEISRGLKGLAKELSIPVIALSQLSRSVEQRGGDKKPILSDLRESGSIEMDSDMVMFCYRPEYYGFEQYEVGSKTFDAKGLFMLIVAKHRNGELGEIPLRFIGEQTKVTNYDEYVDNSVNNTTFVKPNIDENNWKNLDLKPNTDFSNTLSPMNLGKSETEEEEELPF